MATPGKSAKKANKTYIPVKTSLSSPFSPAWSPLPQSDMHFILRTLEEKILSTGLVKKEAKAFRPWRKKAERARPPPTEDARGPRAPPNGWTDVAARRQLAIGINEATKALERNQLRLLLVCKSARPKHVSEHLMALSGSRGVPACQVPRLSQRLAAPLGLRSVLALGFKRSAGTEEHLFADAVEAIRPKVPLLEVAWLPDAALSLKPAGEEEEEAGGGTRVRKRKLESEEQGKEAAEKRVRERELEAGVAARAESSAALQPLRVKRVRANPTKQNRRKKKKKRKES